MAGIFHIATESRPAQGPTQIPLLWVPTPFSGGGGGKGKVVGA